MVRKLLMTGGLVLASANGSAQFLVAQIISTIYLVTVIRTMPYERDQDDFLQLFASTSILFTLMAGFALKAEERVAAVAEEAGMSMMQDEEANQDLHVIGTALVVINATVFLFAMCSLVYVLAPALLGIRGKLALWKKRREAKRQNKARLEKKLGARVDRNKTTAKGKDKGQGKPKAGSSRTSRSGSSSGRGKSRGGKTARSGRGGGTGRGRQQSGRPASKTSTGRNASKTKVIPERKNSRGGGRGGRRNSRGGRGGGGRRASGRASGSGGRRR